jgi:hypothetical protein
MTTSLPTSAPGASASYSTPSITLPEGSSHNMKRIAEIYGEPYRIWYNDRTTCKCLSCQEAPPNGLTHSPASPNPWTYYDGNDELQVLYASEIKSPCETNDYNLLVETLKNLYKISPESGRTYYFSMIVLQNEHLSSNDKVKCLYAFLAGIVLGMLGGDAVYEVYRANTLPIVGVASLLDWVIRDLNLKSILIHLKPAFAVLNEFRIKKEITDTTWSFLVEYPKDERDANKLVARMMRKSIAICEPAIPLVTFLTENIESIRDDAWKRRGPAVLFYYHARSRNSVDGCDCGWCNAKRTYGR